MGRSSIEVTRYRSVEVGEDQAMGEGHTPLLSLRLSRHPVSHSPLSAEALAKDDGDG